MVKVLNILVVIAFFVAMIALAASEARWRPKTRARLTWSAALFLIAFFAVRDFGLDLEPYKLIFAELDTDAVVSNLPWSLFTRTLEPLFTMGIVVMRRAGLGFNGFLLLGAFVTFGLVARVIVRTERFPMLALLLFSLLFLFRSADAVRHAAASSVYLLGLYIISQRRRVRGYAIVGLSALLHYSNALLLATTPALRIRWNVTTYAVACLVTLAASYPIGLLIRSGVEGEDFYLLWKLGYYLDAEQFMFFQNELHRALLAFLFYFTAVYVFALNLFLLHKRLIPRSDRFRTLLLNSQAIGSLIALFFIAIGAPIIAARVLLPMAFGSFILSARAITREAAEPPAVNRNGFSILVLILLIYNFVVVLYNAGVAHPMSPFFLG